jgi:hypothetical protein
MDLDLAALNSRFLTITRSNYLIAGLDIVSLLNVY